MTDADRLLQAILTNPSDDGPRLALADWLMDRDNEASRLRGEFIAVQCRLASFGPRAAVRLYHEQQERTGRPCETISCAWCPLRRRELQLLHNLSHRWFSTGGRECVIDHDGRLLVFLDDGADVTTIRFVRGFAEEITWTAEACVEHLDRIREAHPVQRVVLTTWPRVASPDGERTCLRDDPKQSQFTNEELNAVHRAGDWLAMNVLRCRWPGIDFTLPEPDGDDFSENDLLLQRIRQRARAELLGDGTVRVGPRRRG